MRRPLPALILLAACGGPARHVTAENRSEVPSRKPADVVFLGAAQGVIVASCRDVTTGAMRAEGCADRVKGMVAAGSVVAGSDGARYRLTGEASDGCDASGETMITTLAREDGAPSEVPPTIAVSPPDADVGLVTYEASFEPVKRPEVPADVLAAITTLANRAIAERGSDAPIEASALVPLQSLDADVDGDGAVDRIVSVQVPRPDAEGPGYAYSGVVLVPGGHAEATKELWTSDLEHMVIEATLDADGDGTLELVYSAEYYEGAGVGFTRILDGKLDMIAQYGCGA